jgi:hypothetical protein
MITVEISDYTHNPGHECNGDFATTNGPKTYCAGSASVPFDSSTAPVTREANAGKIHANVQEWTLPIETSSANKMPLVIQQSTPRIRAWAMGNRRLSKNEPTITNAMPTSSMEIADRAQTCVFSKLCLPNKAYRNTPPALRIAPIGNAHLDTLNLPRPMATTYIDLITDAIRR